MKNPFKGAGKTAKAQKAARKVQEVVDRAATDKAVKDSTTKAAGFRGAGRGWLSWLRGD